MPNLRTTQASKRLEKKQKTRIIIENYHLKRMDIKDCESSKCSNEICITLGWGYQEPLNVDDVKRLCLMTCNLEMKI